MPLLTRDQILQADDVRTEDVECPEWGGTVRVRVLSGTERDQFEAGQAELRRVNRIKNIRAKWVSLCAVGEDGKRVFSDDDVVALGKKSSAALDRVFDAVVKLNGLSKDEVDELEKNSESGLNGSSGSS